MYPTPKEGVQTASGTVLTCHCLKHVIALALLEDESKSEGACAGTVQPQWYITTKLELLQQSFKCALLGAYIFSPPG